YFPRKKILADAADRLSGLGNEIADHTAVLSPAQQQVSQAERAFEGHDARSAIAKAKAASETVATLIATLEHYAAIRGGIVQARNDAERLSVEGYRMETSQGAIDGARTALSEAGRALQAGGPAAAAVKLQVAQTMLDEAVAHGAGLVTVRQENDQRLAAIEAAGLQAAALITEGRRAFDLVDEFAESTWNDIRGNGSEAEAAANRAHDHWASARQRNTMEAQAFYEAKEDLDAATQELAFVNQLIDAILTRLRDLDHAREAARATLDEAQRSITASWEFVRRNDADVGKDPELKLQRAQELLGRAQAEASTTKPNWLSLVRDAQEADQLADAALAGARGEAEAMEKLRQQADQARQITEAEVTKIVKFVGLHRDDLQPASAKAVDDLRAMLDKARVERERADKVEEDQRRAAFSQSTAAYRKLQQESGLVYQQAYGDVQRLEQLRSELNDELTKARAALQESEGLYASYGQHVPGSRGIGQRIQSARRSFDQIRLPITGEAQLNKTISVARAISSEARDVTRELRSHAPRGGGGGGGGGDGLGSFIGGVIVGEILNGSRNHGGWGGSGGWSGGRGGDGGWSSGGGGGGGGSFGGGGGGGSFGGGGGGGGW
ncbi:MAG: TPM domain-containing protein, partial [Oscillochloris sp.]|nr:TPM domain-containing protein [Oscillochloris sp.]